MKHLAIFMLFIFALQIYAQKGSRGPNVEIFVGQKNVSWTLTWKMENVGDVWKRTGSVADNWSYETTSVYDSPSLHLTGNSAALPTNWDGFNFHIIPDVGTFNFAYGKYKVSLWEYLGDEVDDFYFYLDYRHFLYPTMNYSNHSPYNDNDIWIKAEYDSDDSTYSYYYGESASDVDGAGEGNSISSGSTLTLWGIEGVTHSSLILDVDNTHPKLKWGPSPIFDGASYFQLYRASSSSQTSKPQLLNYQMIYQTSNASTWSYLDEDVRSASADWIYYYVKKNSGYPSNYVEFNGEFYKTIKNETEDDQLVLTSTFALNQNHPNPFNPTSTISYQLPETQYVTLRVYNTLGEEMADLVNETKEAGVYSVNFDASNLPSGVYVYKITAGKLC